MLIQALLQRAPGVAEDEVLQDFIASLVPQIMEHYGGMAALGGDPGHPPEAGELPEGVKLLTHEEYAYFASGYDQSLAVHLLNGVFAGLRLMRHGNERRPLQVLHRKVWVLGFVLHDYTKARGISAPASQREAIRAICSQEGERLGFARFLSDWRDYLGDITFIAQNTQRVHGADLSPYAYHLRLPERVLADLRIVATFADILVHVLAPADVAGPSGHDGRERHLRLREALATFLGVAAPRLAYHQLAEVRGLLSNALNNALIAEMEGRGFAPYLFFSNGVVYLAPADVQLEPPAAEAVVAAAWQEIVTALIGPGRSAADATALSEDTSNGASETESAAASGSEAGSGFGFQRDGKGLKIAPMLYELLSVPDLIAEARHAVLNFKSASAARRLGAERVRDEGWPDDSRVDQLAEYLTFLKRRIYDELYPQAGGATALLLRHLGLTAVISEHEAEANNGGVPTGWYEVACRYLAAHPATDTDDLEALMCGLGEVVWSDIRQRQLSAAHEPQVRAAFARYVRAVVQVDGRPLIDGVSGAAGRVSGMDAGRARFADELRFYQTNKAENKPLCSLCAAADVSTDQAATVVLFKPQQYSNKNPLSRARVVRGICPLCTLEMMLRQACQPVRAGTYQDQKPITMWLYPAYFFTPETAAAVKEGVHRLRDLRLWEGHDALLPELRSKAGGPLTIGGVLRYEAFARQGEDDDDAVSRPRTIQAPRFSTRDRAALFFFGLTPTRSESTDTAAWVLPAFYALALPLLLGVKVVATPSFVPLYGTGSEFRETVRLDSEQAFIQHILRRDRFRINELPGVLLRLLALYDLHTTAFGEGFNAHWGQLNAVAKDVATNPYYVFAYFDQWQRSKEARAGKGGGPAAGGQIWPNELRRYQDIYTILKGDTSMGMIETLVDAYTAFYRAEDLKSSFGVLKPFRLAIDTIMATRPEIGDDDLIEAVAGQVYDMVERTHDNQAEGRDPIWYNRSLGSVPERLALLRARVREFAALMVQEVFKEYCAGDRAVLREQTNLLSSAARFAYLRKYGLRAAEPEEAVDMVG